MLKKSVRSEAERDRLVEANIALALYAAREFHEKLPPHVKARYTLDDARSDATVGLVRAAELFRPEIAEFSTYAYKWFFQAMSRGSKKSTVVSIPGHRFGKEGMPSVFTGFSGCSGSWKTRAGSEHKRTVADSELVDMVASAIRYLPARQRKVIEMRMRESTLQQVASETGVSKERVRQLEKKARARIKAFVEKTLELEVLTND